MNLIEFGLNKISVTFRGFNVETSHGVFKNPMMVARLLTYDELKRVDRCLSSENTYNSLLIEEDVFRTTFHGIVGLDEALDIDETISVIDAGILSAYADIIVSMSFEYIHNFENKLAESQASTEWVEQIRAIVCRYLNTSYSEVCNWPIDMLVAKYAVLTKTFADVPGSKAGQSTDESDSE